MGSANVPQSPAISDTPTHNSDAPWDSFSSENYWRANYSKIIPEDQEIIYYISDFLVKAFRNRDRVVQAIDVGTGANLYPALLMLPWTEQILLTDLSAGNVRWLNSHVADDSTEWTWDPFWRELQGIESYSQISEPRQKLRQACAGIEQRSMFTLPEEQWDLGTMFFVAESITEDSAEFREAIAKFVGALKPGAPFATAFMAGSHGYMVGDTHFPAVPITPDDVSQRFTEVGARELNVELVRTPHRVRDGYQGMFVATGFVG